MSTKQVYQHSQQKVWLVLLFFNAIVLCTSCSSDAQSTSKTATTEAEKKVEESADQTAEQSEEPVKKKYSAMHSYGAWYCPDNLRGFPAVDLANLDEVPVINGRLPTEEETKSAQSLMYIDKEKIPTARALDMKMPRVARYYSDHTEKNELVIVIQAVVAEQDTVVGFRFLNGGNGSAWFGEVEFLSDQEVKELGPTPFVTINHEIKAKRERVMEVLTSPIYTSALGKPFAQSAFILVEKPASGWDIYKKSYNGHLASTNLMDGWGLNYLQFDYNIYGHHMADKILLLKNEEEGTTELQVTSGPYGKDFEAQHAKWDEWLAQLIYLCE